MTIQPNPVSTTSGSAEQQGTERDQISSLIRDPSIGGPEETEIKRSKEVCPAATYRIIPTQPE